MIDEILNDTAGTFLTIGEWLFIGGVAAFIVLGAWAIIKIGDRLKEDEDVN